MPPSEAKSTADTLSDIRQMVVDYAKQETIEPLKGIGRYLKWGIPGAVLISLGVFLLGLAGLRALQTETGTTFTGNLSWIPYLIVVGGLALVVAAAVLAINRGRSSS